MNPWRRWQVVRDFNGVRPTVVLSHHRWEFTALVWAVGRNRLDQRLDRAHIVRPTPAAERV